MLASLVTHQRIVTTLPKAKELAPLADKLITFAKTGTLHSYRLAKRQVPNIATLTTLFDDLGHRYKDREGGYTRVLKLSKPRAGDKADMAVIEFVDRLGEIRVAKNPSYDTLQGGEVRSFEVQAKVNRVDKSIEGQTLLGGGVEKFVQDGVGEKAKR